jgi:hypothetical protein
VAGELGVAVEAADRADFGEELGCCDAAAAGEFEQRPRDRGGPLFELLVELVDRPRQRAAAVTSSRAIRTCSSCSRRASQRLTRSR